MHTINLTLESKFVVVEFTRPLDAPMCVGEARDRTCLGDDERWLFTAYAEGERLSEKSQKEEVMLFLIYDKDEQRFVVLENWTDEWKEAVLLDIPGQIRNRPLPPMQALAQWIAGFMLMNEKFPGSNSLRYRLIEG